jgi:putative FmdB family regulatory protein
VLFEAQRTTGAPCSLSEIDSQPKTMPVYEYVCRKCGEKIAEVLTIKEHETKKVQCPKCQSTEVEKIIEPFFAKTSRKS